MSGPWDRPSSPSPDDQDWPAEDFESSSRPHQPADLWSTDDPWQERATEPSAGWDVWPPPAPAPEDYVLEEPPPPSNDPWAESWTDDVPGMPFADGPSYAGTREEQRSYTAPPGADRSYAAPVDTEAAYAAPPDTDAAYAAPPEAEAPRVEPWRPSSDPWGPASVEPWTPSEPWREERELEAVPDPSPEAPAPSWPAEPMRLAPSPEAPPEEASTFESIEPEREGSAGGGDTEAVEPEHVRRDSDGPAEPDDGADRWSATGLDEDAVASEPHVRGDPPSPAAAAYERAYRSIFPSADDAPAATVPPFAEPEREPTPPPEPPRQPAQEPEAQPQATAVEPERGGARELDTAPMDEPGPALEDVEPPPTHADAPPEFGGDRFWSVSGSGSDDAGDESMESVSAASAPPRPIEPSWEADLWVERDATPDPIGETSGEAGSAPESIDAAPWAEPYAEPAHEPTSPDRGWQPPEPGPAPGESTQVLPTSWVAPRPSSRDDRASLVPESGQIRTSLGTDADADEDLAARPSTAEQAVPWLIGVILLLAGMVIVLLALIFAGDGSLGGAAAAPSASGGVIISTASSSEPSASPPTSGTSAPSANAPSASAIAAPSATPAPQYGALEMVYQGRSAALAPIYLLRHDFTTAESPQVLAQDPNLDVRRFSWAPDGTVGAGLYADLLIAIQPDAEKRNLADGIVSLTFGSDASTLYAVRLTEDGADDVLTVMSIDYASGETTELRSISYNRPAIEEEDALREGQFADDGGPIRLYWLHDGMLRLWSLGAGAWDIDPESGEFTDAEGLPVLWSPGGARRIALTEEGGDTTITLHEGDDEEPVAQTALSGFVSHVRWSPDGERVVFTLGRTTRSGGIVQDLFLWDLETGVTPMQLTSTGAAFGAEWLGSAPRWEAAE